MDWRYNNSTLSIHINGFFMATLQIIGEDNYYLLELSQTGIGRVHDNEMAIDDESVSAYHALITVMPCATSKEGNNEYIIEDLESTNKTFVNGKRITKHKLKDGDIIRVGETRVKFSLKKHPIPQQEFQKTKKLN